MASCPGQGWALPSTWPVRAAPAPLTAAPPAGSSRSQSVASSPYAPQPPAEPQLKKMEPPSEGKVSGVLWGGHMVGTAWGTWAGVAGPHPRSCPGPCVPLAPELGGRVPVALQVPATALRTQLHQRRLRHHHHQPDDAGGGAGGGGREARPEQGGTDPPLCPRTSRPLGSPSRGTGRRSPPRSTTSTSPSGCPSTNR